jgi:hypothetical protein
VARVDVGTLLFGLYYLDGHRAARRRIRQWHPASVSEEVPVVNGQTWQRLQRPEVDLLPLRLSKIWGPGADPGCEIADPVDSIPWE